jgi:hypothetical protein
VALATLTETLAEMRKRGAFSTVPGEFTFRDPAGSVIDENTQAIGYARSSAGIGILCDEEDWVLLQRRFFVRIGSQVLRAGMYCHGVVRGETSGRTYGLFLQVASSGCGMDLKSTQFALAGVFPIDKSTLCLMGGMGLGMLL